MTANMQDEDELQQIVEQGYQSCSFDGCDYGIDPRGPAFLRGTSYPVCSPHFEAVFGVIGRQQQQPYDEDGAVGEQGVTGATGNWVDFTWGGPKGPRICRHL